MLSGDEPLMEMARSGEAYTSRCELIAPLDNMIWDRKLMEALFDFSYTWEIYVTHAKRKYGYYVLPVLMGECFVGRIEGTVKSCSQLRTPVAMSCCLGVEWYERFLAQV